MKKLTLVIICSLSLLIVACGKKTENIQQEHMSEVFQDIYNIDEDSADELAEIVDDFAEVAIEEYNEEYKNASELDKTEDTEILINECYRDLFDRSTIIFDFDSFFMEENDLISKYGEPKEKDGNSLIWYFDNPFEGFVRIIPQNSFFCGMVIGEKKYNATPLDASNYSHHFDSSDFKKVEEYFNDKEFNYAYSYSEMKTYEDFINSFGNTCYLWKMDEDDIYVMWLYPDQDLTLTLKFDKKSSEVKIGNPIIGSFTDYSWSMGED